MHDPLALPVPCHAHAQLQHAPRIRGGDTIGAGGIDAGHLLFEQSHGHVRVDHVVNSSAAATDIGERHFTECETGDALQ